MANQEIELSRDCEGTLIPAGEAVILPKGSLVQVTQSLGGSITVRHGMNLIRLGGEDWDALGEGFQKTATDSEKSSDRLPGEGEFHSGKVWEVLKTCFDPEIPVNIVDLGLIYDLRLTELENARQGVDVKMTLTAQGCGMGPAIAADAKAKIEALPEVDCANVEIVWDPQWTPEMISAEGRKVLGLD